MIVPQNLIVNDKNSCLTLSFSRAIIYLAASNTNQAGAHVPGTNTKQESIMKIFFNLKGSGWYAPRQEGQWENVHVTFYKVTTDASSDAYGAASNDAHCQGLGTPEWINTQDDIESPST